MQASKQLMWDIRSFIGSLEWCSVLHADPMLPSLEGSTNPASCNLLQSSHCVWGVCMLWGLGGGHSHGWLGRTSPVHHCGKNAFCLLKAIFHCSPGKAECEGLSTSRSADVTAFFLLWRNVAVGRAWVCPEKKWGWALFSHSAELAHCVAGEGMWLLPLYPTQLSNVIASDHLQEQCLASLEHHGAHWS